MAFSKQTIELHRKYADEGYTVTQMAELFKTCKGTIRSRLRSWNIQTRYDNHAQIQKQEKLKERDLLICKEYLSGKTLEECAQPCGMTRERVRQILVRYNITERFTRARKRREARSEDWEKIMPLYLAGYTFPEACKELGIKYSGDLQQYAKKPRTALQIKVHKVARFWRYVKKNDFPHPELGTPCWLWIGSTNPITGYGRTGLFREYGQNAHKTAFCLVKGMPKTWVLHRCDISACVNPDHLYDGTPKENCADRDKNGPRGPILTLNDATDIRTRLQNGETVADVAKLYNVSGATVYNIQRNRTHTGSKRQRERIYTDADIAGWFRLKQTMTFKEVAERAGVPYGSITSYLYRAEYQHLKPTSGTTED